MRSPSPPRLRKYTTGVLRQKVVARLRDDLAELRAAAQERFDSQPVTLCFQEGQDQVQVWQAADFDPWGSLRWTRVRMLRYGQIKPSGEVIEAYWLTKSFLA